VDERSTTLSARLTDEPRDIRLVEIDLRGLNSSPLVGRRVRLDFQTKLAFVGADIYSKDHPVFDIWAEVTVSKDRSAPPHQLGRLRLSEPAFVVPNANEGGSWTRSVQLRLEVDQRQLDEIEELRAGGGLSFSLALDGLIYLPSIVGRLNPASQLFYQVSQSDWVRLLDQVQYGRYVTIEVAIPSAGEMRGELVIAANALREATEALSRGADEEAVADCRDAFDALTRLMGVRPQAGFGDQSLSKDERFVYVQRALLNLAHPAHHPNDPAASAGAGSVRWDRADAQAVIAMLAALIRRIVT
jgi:hypothetical protein